MAKKKLHPAMQYAADVRKGNILAGRLVKLAVKRHTKDLKDGHKRGLYFDEEAATHAIDFFAFLKHTKGALAGKTFELAPFQQFKLWCLFGWKNNDGTRRFKYAYNEIARKGGKTTEAAGVANYLLVGDGESGAEIYTAATKKDQAKIAFHEAQNQIRSSAQLKDYVGVHKNNLHILATSSKMEPLSSDSHTLDGLNPSGVILDEFHAHKDQGALYHVLKSATGSREQPLIYIITTAGFNKESACFKLRKTCIDILEGRKVDDTMFIMIFTLDEGDDWKDEEVWIKANPNLGNSISMKYLRDEYNQAKNNPSEEVNFKTKNLNIWTDSSMAWINDDDWMLCNLPGDPDKLEGRVCYAGLDLASTTDVNAFVMVFPDEDGEYFEVICHFWIPEIKAQKKADQVDYLLWANQGYVTLTDGNIVDHRIIERDIKRIIQNYHLQSLAIDRALAYTGLAQSLMEEELPLNNFGQGFVSMSEPTKELERKIQLKRINHFGNPVLRWMASNVELKLDPAGNIKIDKSKSSEKVDGMVALVMALGAFMTPPESEDSVYLERGIRTL
jgi:phage terminase large subunit-like protein